MPGDAKAIFDYIFDLTGSDVKLELSRVEKFMHAIQTPHEAYPVIHIAGTNGKGSTASMLSSMLQGYGYKVGLFTSPHLIRPNERICVNGQPVPDEFIIAKVTDWRPHIEKLGITFFEVLTALGMAYFKEQAVDFAVLETGLGGRLDATNVVNPMLSVITSISRDHENILGNTIEAITYEKAGIIKPGKPVVLGTNCQVVQDLIQTRCLEQAAPLTYAPDFMRIQLKHQNLEGQQLEVSCSEFKATMALRLLGSHQIDNFSTALTALSVLNLGLDAEKIQKGLDQLSWAGRMEVLQTHPTVLYDVAHNPDGLQKLLSSLTELGLRQTTLVAAFNARKDISEMIRIMSAWQGPVFFTLFKGHSSVGEKALREYGIPADRIVTSPEQAYEIAIKDSQGLPVCFFGSHYLAEEIYPLFKPGRSLKS